MRPCNPLQQQFPMSNWQPLATKFILYATDVANGFRLHLIGLWAWSSVLSAVDRLGESQTEHSLSTDRGVRVLRTWLKMREAATKCKANCHVDDYAFLHRISACHARLLSVVSEQKSYKRSLLCRHSQGLCEGFGYAFPVFCHCNSKQRLNSMRKIERVR
jgi:hypothetical protein